MPDTVRLLRLGTVWDLFYLTAMLIELGSAELLQFTDQARHGADLLGNGLEAQNSMDTTRVRFFLGRPVR